MLPLKRALQDSLRTLQTPFPSPEWNGTIQGFPTHRNDTLSFCVPFVLVSLCVCLCVFLLRFHFHRHGTDADTSEGEMLPLKRALQDSLRTLQTPFQSPEWKQNRPICVRQGRPATVARGGDTQRVLRLLKCGAACGGAQQETCLAHCTTAVLYGVIVNCMVFRSYRESLKAACGGAQQETDLVQYCTVSLYMVLYYFALKDL